MGVKDNPVLYLADKLWTYSAGNRKKVILYSILFIIANAINFIPPLILGYMLNIVQEQGIDAQTMPKIIFSLSLFVILTLAFWFFHGPARTIERKNAFLVRSNYKRFLLDGVMYLNAQWHTDHHSGDTIDKIEKGTTAMYNFSTSSYEIIETLMRFFGAYIALTYFNLQSSYIVLLIVAITLTIIIKFDKVLIPQYKELNKQENQVSAKVFDIISNITTIIILRVQKIVSSNIYNKIMSPFALYKKNTNINETKWFLVSVLGSLMTFLILFTYIFTNYKAGNTILVGTIVILYSYVDRINGLFFRFTYRYADIVRYKTNVNNAEELVNDFIESRKKNAKSINRRWKTIKVKNLDFSYHHKKGVEKNLKNISITINNGQRVAFIGESGSGKTTMLKIIIDLYTPNEMELYIDNKKIQGFNDISEDVTLLPQDPELFATTIEENITMGGVYDQKTIEKYVEIACFTNVVNRLPKKYQSSIRERGVNLSGGEKQRLALARGLLAFENKEILLLDEPTSSVDSKNEIRIYRNIFKEFKGKTIISSIHRLHLLHLFDNIYFFKDGKIIASGNFKKLIKSSPEFRKTWKKYNSIKHD